MMAVVLQLSSLGLLVVSGVLIVQQLRAPYQFAQWKTAWSALLLAVALAGIRRLTILATDTPSVGDGLYALSLSGSLLVGFWYLSRIFTSPLHLTHTTEGAVIETDSFSTIVAWDARATVLFGWTTAEAIGQTLMQTVILSRDWEKHRASIARILASGDDALTFSRTYAITAQRKTGEEIPVTIKITAVPQADGTLHFVGLVRQLATL